MSAGAGLYWMDGQIWPKPPAALTNCDPGFYKDGCHSFWICFKIGDCIPNHAFPTED